MAKNDTPPATKKELLEAWDEVTAELDANWPKITEERFQEQLHAFGNESWAGPAYSIIQYFVDNEIHHRGQGYGIPALAGHYASRLLGKVVSEGY